MTKGELIFEVSRELGLDDTENSEELILMQRWLKRGVVDVLLRTHCYVDIGVMALQAGVTDYRTDASILAVDNITLPDTTGQPYQLTVVPMTEILPYLSPGVAATATPTYVAIEGTLMRIAPVPSTAISLTYIYVPHPSDMGTDGTKALDNLDPSTPAYGGIPTAWHDAILMFMLWKGAEYDDKGGGFYRGHAYAPGFAYAQTYQDMIKDIKRQQRRKAGRGLHRGRVGYPDRRSANPRNDVYPRNS